MWGFYGTDKDSILQSLSVVPAARRPCGGAHQKEFGIEPQLEEGGLGEFTVWVGGEVVARKGWLRFPPDEKMLAAVRQRLST